MHKNDMILLKEEIARIKKSCGSHNDVGFGYDDLYMHPYLELPERYKVLKFDIFNRIKNLMTHLRSYYD